LICFVQDEPGQNEPSQPNQSPLETAAEAGGRRVANVDETGSMKPCWCQPEKSEVVHQILTYLIENPGAQDTVEGIVDWWLLDQEIQRQTVKVKEALTDLVAKRFILARKGRDCRIHYRINRSKVKQIRELIKQRPPQH
jgi:hypothetical protein